MALDDRGELLRSLLEARRAEVGPAEGLADRALVGLERPGALERDRGGHEVARLEQLAALAKQLVCPLRAHRSPSTVLRAPASFLIVSSSSRIAAATASFVASGTWRSAAAVTIVISLSAASKPISEREMSLTTTASRPLRSSLARPRSTAPAPCSAAKPIRVWPGARSAA